ncbi:MAG TPA: CRTAC1 family protein [Flavobacteriales bacterium]|nr:CRTAC1 family protein [Flavobacteriales bacterium]
MALYKLKPSLKLLLVVYTCVVACGIRDNVIKEEKNSSVVETLSLIAIDSSFIENKYLSHFRSDYFLSRLIQNPSSELYFNTALEFLNSGKPEKAIELIEVLLEKINHHEFKISLEFSRQIKTLQSICYLRKGEQDNCIRLHNGASCIFPLRGDAIYSVTESTQEALVHYLELLKEDKNDFISLWLLNVAYMALGQYPDSVPADFLLRPNAFKSDTNIGKFKNIGNQLLIGTRGLAGGCCVDDFDNDGFLDVIVSSMEIKDPLKYFHNEGNGSFKDISHQAGLGMQLGGLNILHADFDNDGWLDLLVLRGGWFQNETGEHPNSLLRNNGNGTFTDVTEKSGLLSFKPTQTAVWADFNLDGWLDLFIGNETKPDDEKSYPCELYINQKDGTFINIAQKIGVDIVGFVKSVTSADVNNDGFPDIYISIFGGQNILFKNSGLRNDFECAFIDITLNAGVVQPNFSFPSWFWDYNNDGWEDLFVATYDYKGSPEDIVREYLGLPIKQAAYSYLYRNNGDGTFTNVVGQVGLNRVLYAMGCNFGDLDNDGYLDFYVGTGAPDFKSIFPNRMFRNDGGNMFQDITTSGGFGHLQKGHGIAFSDLDNDGDQDVYAVLGGAYSGDVFQNALFENPGHKNNWLTIKLVGDQSNKPALGTRIKLILQGEEGIREIHRTVTTGGSFGCSSMQVEIGLGKAEKVIEIVVFWPASGIKQTFQDIPVNRFILIAENKNQIIELDRKKISF